GAIAVGTADGALHVVALALRDATPVLGPVTRRALSDGAIAAIAWDPAGLWVAGGADGQLWVIGEGQRAVSPGGDGGIRAARRRDGRGPGLAAAVLRGRRRRGQRSQGRSRPPGRRARAGARTGGAR